jgi:4-amino-4-deoxy-L-arabinose transferase-like glycosyltransferase
LILVCFTLLAGVVLALTPPWEANDEPFHVQNVETLVSGHWYRISPSAGLESHQAPLYYMVLAAYQKLAKVRIRSLDEQFAATLPFQQRPHFIHNAAQDGQDQRFLDFLRFPSIVFGLATIVFTFIAARFVTKDRWTPVIAAAIVAFVPRFVFLSGVINNDNLSNALGGAALAAALALVCATPVDARRRALAAAGIGLLAGTLVLTKLTAALVAPGLLMAVIFSAADHREAFRNAVLFAAGAFAVCGWWLLQNQVRYGDPLAAAASRHNFKVLLPSIVQLASPMTRIFDQIPSGLYKSFWYTSGWNQFVWHWFWYLPFWLLAAVGIAGLIRRSGGIPPTSSKALWVCVAVAIGSLAIVWVLGLQTNTEQGRTAFVGLPAIAILIALGYERLGWRIPWRFALPVIGLIGTLAAIRYNVIFPYS